MLTHPHAPVFFCSRSEVPQPAALPQPTAGAKRPRELKASVALAGAATAASVVAPPPPAPADADDQDRQAKQVCAYAHAWLVLHASTLDLAVWPALFIYVHAVGSASQRCCSFWVPLYFVLVQGGLCALEKEVQEPRLAVQAGRV